MKEEVERRRQAAYEDQMRYEAFELQRVEQQRVETGIDMAQVLLLHTIVFPAGLRESTPEFSRVSQPEIARELGATSLSTLIALDLNSSDNPLNRPENVYAGYSREDLALAA